MRTEEGMECARKANWGRANETKTERKRQVSVGKGNRFRTPKLG